MKTTQDIYIPPFPYPGEVVQTQVINRPPKSRRRFRNRNRNTNHTMKQVDCFKSDLQIRECPFCGGTRVDVFPNGTPDNRYYIVRCLMKRGGCGASIGGATKEEAIRHWNSRYTETLGMVNSLEDLEFRGS